MSIRKVFPIGVWLLTLGVVATVHLHPLSGSGTKVVASALAIFVALAASLIWFAFFTRYSKAIRLSTLAGCVLVLGALMAIFRVDAVSGELIPRLALRWTPKTDRHLDPLRTNETDGIDLSPTPADFPQFLGANRDLKAPDVGFSFNWDRTAPREVWRRPIGAGWSGFAAVNGFAITMEQRGEQEITACYEIKSGNPIWAAAATARHETRIGGTGPRSTPTIHEGMVYVLGATGILRCLDGSNGQEQWRRELLVDFGIEDDGAAVAWGRAASPLIVDSMVVVPAGGPEDGPQHSLVAYNRLTGDEVWRGGNRQVSYGSPSLATLDGMRQILIVAEDAVGGHDPSTGELLWEHDWPGHSATQANTSQAVAVGPNRVLVTKGYGQGAAVLEIADHENGWQSREVWRERTVLKTKYTNVAVFEEHIYGLNDVFLECVELKTGRRRWKKRYDYGQVLLVGSTLLVLDENGSLFSVKAQPEQHEQLGKLQALDPITWNNLCLYDSYLLLRNGHEAVCYQLPRRTSERAEN